MKIALVTPSPIPFLIGGAEKLFIGMLNAFNTLSNHQLELIKLPCKDQEFWSLMECYRKFYHLDLTHFDAVITTKYPAWMIQHPHHILYMQHPCRGVYDLYKGERDFTTITRRDPRLKPLEKILLSRLTTNGSRADFTQVDLDRFFQLLFTLKKQVSPEHFTFPNPLTRAIIHFLDAIALDNVHSFNAISKTVATREDYFPNDVPIKVIHHPSSLEGFSSQGYDYIFTASRLEDLKRVDLLIEAYKKVKTDIPFMIAGTGGQEQKLKALAKGDERIKFLGFVTDNELLKHYAHALFVPFVPYNEDYGLITIEAMSSQKAVLTVTDSGGVNELVKNGYNGLVLNPDRENIAQGMQQLIDDRATTIEMGKNAIKSVAHISWENLITSLLDDLAYNKRPLYSIAQNQRLPKETPNALTIVSTYPVYPPRSGGQNRLFYLYKYLATYLDRPIEIVSLTHSHERYEKREISKNLFEIRIPKTKQHEKLEHKIEKEVGIPVTDITIDALHQYTPLFRSAIESSFKHADLLICEHPYTFDICLSITKDPKSIIHSSHNVEYLLKKDMLKKNRSAQKLLQKVFDLEKRALKESLATFVCSDEDGEKMREIYNLNIETLLIPNGVDTKLIEYIPKERRDKLKKELGIESRVALFMGSFHKPNIEAVNEIIKLSYKTPEINYIIIGSVKEAFKNMRGKNVAFTGVISEEEKSIYLQIADFALNPMLTGSGTNLKILEYLAAGLPTITTPLGARGLNLPKETVLISNIDNFHNSIKDLDQIDTEKARVFVEKNFDWRSIARKYFFQIKLLLKKYNNPEAK